MGGTSPPLRFTTHAGKAARKKRRRNREKKEKRRKRDEVKKDYKRENPGDNGKKRAIMLDIRDMNGPKAIFSAPKLFRPITIANSHVSFHFFYIRQLKAQRQTVFFKSDHSLNSVHDGNNDEELKTREVDPFKRDNQAPRRHSRHKEFYNTQTARNNKKMMSKLRI